MKGIVRNYRKELARRQAKEVSFCELPEIVVEKYGNVYIVVDMELKGRIREALLKMICEFEIDEH